MAKRVQKNTHSPPQSLSEQIQKVGEITDTTNINTLPFNDHLPLPLALQQRIIQFPLDRIGHDTFLHLCNPILLGKIETLIPNQKSCVVIQ